MGEIVLLGMMWTRSKLGKKAATTNVREVEATTKQEPKLRTKDRNVLVELRSEGFNSMSRSLASRF
jgi:hypothetical protein